MDPARQALQELVRLQDGDVSLHSQWALAWDAARAALAEPVAQPQQPIAWMAEDGRIARAPREDMHPDMAKAYRIPLYGAPVAEPQEPVGWLWMHDETGRTFVQYAADTINPDEFKRWHRVGPLYLHAAPPSHARDAEIAKLPWTHGCDGALGNITLWINACPHCGMPRKPVAAIDEARRKT